MAKYLVELDPTAEPKKNGVRAFIVDADDEAGAKALAASYADGDGPWADSTATALAAAGAANYAGFRINIRVSGHTNAKDILNYSYTYVAAATIDGAGAAIAAELAALGGVFTGAAYDAPSNTLKVAAAAQGIGDHKLSVEITPPTCSRPFAPLVGAIVDGGAAGADLTVVLTGLAAIPCVQKVIR
jgi:hypothetical protein